jgi:hypothetical protein
MTNLPQVTDHPGLSEKSGYEKLSGDKSFKNLREVDSRPNLPLLY